MACFHARLCFLEVLLILLPFRGQIPKNAYFMGVNRHLQAKCTKYSNFHIIKTNAAIPTRFGRMIKTSMAKGHRAKGHRLPERLVCNRQQWAREGPRARKITSIALRRSTDGSSVS